MNNDILVKRSLRKKNKDNHEQAECIDSRLVNEIRGAEWVAFSELDKRKKAGWLLGLDAEQEKVLLSDFYHMLLLGTTGTGKSQIIKNYIDTASRIPDTVKPSMLIADPKGEISAEKAGELEQKRGYKVFIVNGKNVFRSIRYNPLSTIYDDYHKALEIKKMLDNKEIKYLFDGVQYKTQAEARAAASMRRLKLLSDVEKRIAEIGEMMIDTTKCKEPSWQYGARGMLSAILLTMLYDSENEENGMTRECFTFANLSRIASTTDDDCEKIVSWLKRARANLTVDNAITSYYDLRAKQTRDSFISTLNNSINPYTSHTIGALTASSYDLNPADIAKSDKPYAIFMITDDQEKVTNNICMMFMNDLVRELVRVADTNEKRSLNRDFVILADEFANMPPMPDMSYRITTFRSRRIWFMMAIQSIQQLKRVYGAEEAEIIRDNCDLTLFLGCNNLETKTDFVKAMGDRQGESVSYNKANDGCISENYHSVNVPLVKVSDLDSLALGEFYVHSRTVQKMKSYATPYYMRKDVAFIPYNKKTNYNDYNPEKNVYSIRERFGEDRLYGFARHSLKKFNF